MGKISKFKENMGTRKEKLSEELKHVVIRLAGDSGDGMQLAGLKFTSASVFLRNDVSTLPDFPAEIRAPRGTLAGVSGFQIHFSSEKIFTPGEKLDALVVMNPAALHVNIEDLKPGGLLIYNEDEFIPAKLSKAGYTTDPIADSFMEKYRVIGVKITKLNKEAVSSVEGFSPKQFNLTRNFFVLGLLSWLFDRPLKPTIDWIKKKFKSKSATVEANIKTIQAGYFFGETTELLPVQYTIPKATMPPGLYRHISGVQAMALGFASAAKLADKELFFGAYPITPASDVLHELVRLRGYGIRTFQAEDEIAAIGSIIGASFGGALGVTATSGPGFALMTEALGLAVIVELPIVVATVQRAGPSTGMPTKTEQTDLLQTLFSRNGEAPVPVLAPQTPGDCFDLAIESLRLAIKYMTPVILLTDAYLVNTIDPWKVPNLSEYQNIEVNHPTKDTLNLKDRFEPYNRNEKLIRPWVIPGTKGLEHRIGGLEKEENTGNVSYDPLNHEKMVNLRATKIDNIADDFPLQQVNGPSKADLLILSWGSVYGAAHTAAENLRKLGYSVADTNLRYLNPFPKNLESILKSYKRILVPELNQGQLQFLIQARFMIKVISLRKIQGKPLYVREIQEKGEEILDGFKNE
ncbi:MAG: 2-oxoacid:acceptor oxidoreductase subunit alpha [Candidatus Hodarchaeales archaeon]|jgi:2-oxoglutarate ferredoxin oxidoreductase subunit alpha